MANLKWMEVTIIIGHFESDKGIKGFIIKHTMRIKLESLNDDLVREKKHDEELAIENEIFICLIYRNHDDMQGRVIKDWRN